MLICGRALPAHSVLTVLWCCAFPGSLCCAISGRRLTQHLHSTHSTLAADRAAEAEAETAGEIHARWLVRRGKGMPSSLPAAVPSILLPLNLLLTRATTTTCSSRTATTRKRKTRNWRCSTIRAPVRCSPLSALQLRSQSNHSMLRHFPGSDTAAREAAKAAVAAHSRANPHLKKPKKSKGPPKPMLSAVSFAPRFRETAIRTRCAARCGIRCHPWRALHTPAGGDGASDRAAGPRPPRL